MFKLVMAGCWLIMAHVAGLEEGAPPTGATTTGCLLGHPSYSFAGFDMRQDGGTIAGTVRDRSGLTEGFWWDCQFRSNGPVYLGTTDPGDSLGRLVEPGSDCEAALIAALRAFADTQIAHELQTGLVEAIYDGAVPTGEVERFLKSPEPLPVTAVRAAHMARELEKHRQH